ncbi:MAG: vWA domain-containing protein [Candidatus Cyclobacteriaceae bacterium M3_2C_046]
MKNYSFPILFILFSFWACSEGDVEPYGSDTYLTFSGRGLQGFQGDPQFAGGDRYNEYVENPFINVNENPVSTFSVDADGASYANVRRFIFNENTKPPKGAVRTEELINYFDLDYPYTNTTHPIALNGEVSSCPWQAGHKLIRIGIQGKNIAKAQLPPSNFVFLIDVSGSMSSDDKLDLLKQGFKLFVDELGANDKVAIVTYAGNAGVVLPATSGNDKSKIKSAIDKLGAGGSTAGAQGIKTAYEIASANFIKDGNNRVIIGTDGDFNVGISSQEELVSLIEEKRDSGIFLTVLGVGRGNLNDGALEQIANNGNGTYEYIDNLEQLKKVFIYDFDKFYTVAKDVKVQVKFNPVNVASYRLIGYENRVLEEEDFEDDEKDAGEIGAGQNITALYEIIPKSNPNFRAIPTFTIDFRYKNPDEDISKPFSLEIFDQGKAFPESSDYMKFTASVAAFGMVLIDSDYKGSCSLDKVLDWSKDVALADPHNFKSEFKSIVNASKRLN